MPVPQIGNPVPYGDAPGFDVRQRSYNQVRLGQLLQGAYPSGSQDQFPEFGHQSPSTGAHMLPQGQNVDDRFMNSVYSTVSSPSQPPYGLDYGYGLRSIRVPLANGDERMIDVDPDSGMPSRFFNAPPADAGNPYPAVNEEIRHGRAALSGGWAQEYPNAMPGSNYRPQVEMTTPQSPTPPMPPLPQAPPNPNPFYRRPQASMGQMMIEPPSFAGPQPDTTQNYIPYGGRF